MRRKSQVAPSCFLLLSLSIASTYIVPVAGHKHTRRHRDFTAAESYDVSSSRIDSPSMTISPAIDRSSLTEESYFPEIDPCAKKYCGPGRECERSPNGTVALCGCVRKCPRRHRPVCASNGQIYTNHCELHKAACISESPLTRSRLVRCLHHDIENAHTRRTMHANRTSPKPENIVSYPRARDHEKDDLKDNLIPEKDDFDSKGCTNQEYEIMKDNLLLYNHARLMAQDNHSKEYLVSIMFSHYDRNNNGNLEREELDQIAENEDLEELCKGCSLGHMISYDDADGDGKLNVNEFYMAFSKLYSVSVVSLDKSLEVNHISARVDDNVEIKCDVTGTPPPPLVWRRNEANLETLNEPEIRVFSDGSLYLTKVQLMHAGNYTCHAIRNQDVVQTHVLTIHTVPEVIVTPRLQSKRLGEEAIVKCHVAGEPLPQVEWLKNDEPLNLEQPGKYDLIGNGTKLIVKSIDYADTGAYMCQASSVGGVTRDISSLVVQEQPTSTAASEERRFFSFHEWGILVYEPSTCRPRHEIRSTDVIPGTQERVCGITDVPCSWGRAINVANRYVYVSQPDKDRVLVISKIQMVIVDVIPTDKNPVQLWYVASLDQVWLLNWRNEKDIGVKTVQVIEDAGQKKKHKAIRPEPIDAQFDIIENIYIAEPQDIDHPFKYGYVSHTDQRSMYKLDLKNMKYTRVADFSSYNCVPKNVQFSVLYGFVIIECREPVTNRPTGQLLLDYLTDTVLVHKPKLLGRPTISPDSRHLVTLDKQDTGVTLVVQEISSEGLKFAFDVKTTLNISDIALYPSQTTHGYDIYASSIDKEDILFLDLSTGKVEMITGVGKATPPNLTKWGNPNRPIVQSGVFGKYMVSPSNDALFILNGETRTINCEIGGLVHPGAVVWFTVSLR
ncbi:follistatin-related protein 5-like [Hylaeus anthracinus]|uniref:follistatin-related protein 5-like n=1 Tax=Hylaeus anthracinus TaxID=313031 RepID=UPI0023B8AAC8|nr:follistatin-related protein 5-like [Hylaeus anthracinus]XP_054002270.1 follistatin-related protein 5-like [Hylaeus anthracinus]